MQRKKIGNNASTSPPVALPYGLGKLPPQAIELEEAILGSVMIEPCFQELSIIINTHDFYKEAHQRIWACFERLNAKSSPIDLLSVTVELRASGELELTGGATYITQLTTKVNSSSNSEYYARIVSQMSVKRSIINWSANINEMCYQDESDVFDILSDSSSKLSIIEGGLVTGSESSMEKSVDEAVDGLFTGDASSDGIPSSYKEIRDVIRVYEYGSLNCLAARPSVGKSVAMINEAFGIADNRHPVLVISIEMTRKQQIRRIISMITGIDYNALMNARQLSQADQELIYQARDWIKRTPIYILDGSFSISEIRMIMSKYLRKYGVRMVFIDYLQLITHDSGKFGGNRNNEVGDIARTLKTFALKNKIAIVVLSQLSRAADGEKPKLSHLRDSGEIEQHIDTCSFLFRPEMAGIMQTTDGYSTSGIIEIIVAKNRFGSLDEIEMSFSGAKSRLSPKQPKIAVLPLRPIRSGEETPF